MCEYPLYPPCRRRRRDRVEERHETRSWKGKLYFYNWSGCGKSKGVGVSTAFIAREFKMHRCIGYVALDDRAITILPLIIYLPVLKKYAHFFRIFVGSDDFISVSFHFFFSFLSSPLEIP